ncbi:hypothetical protein V8D89_015511 [Ganoderma adspersum]
MALEHKLPNGLLIILHLHLLDFPLQDASGYDERLFHHTRGMRDRNKALEDITYFLVGKLEGTKERAKSILPSYPCVQPADTAAYRIALAKYLERLRNAIVHTKHAHAADPKGKRPASSAEDEVVARWWKDVVVRKSILDECSGDRFERLILALSSHAVLKNAVRTETSSLHPPTPNLDASGQQVGEVRRDVGLLSMGYATQLAAAQTTRFEWERSAALLAQRQIDLAVIRGRIADPKLSVSSKYNGLTTDRLLALRDSRYQDLRRRSWQGDDGQSALRLVTDLAGLLDSAYASTAADSISSEDVITGAKSSSILPVQTSPETPPPLPIAAAHHPAHLHSLGLPRSAPSLLLHPEGGDSQDEDGGPSTPHSISERLAAIARVRGSLQDALLSTRNIQAQLQKRLQKAKTQEAPHPSTSSRKKAPVKSNDSLHVDASLWDRRSGNPIDFKKIPDAPMLVRFSLDATAPSATAIEDRIAHIRTAVLPPFTVEPLLASDSEPELEPEPGSLSAKPPAAGQSSRLRQPTARGQVPTAVPKPNHHGGTVTGSTLPAPSGRGSSKTHPPTRQGRIADGRIPPPRRVPSGAGQTAHGDAATKAGRLSRRASAARTRRSTVFGRGEDADILRIVESVEDRSDPSDEDDANAASYMHTAVPTAHTNPRTPFRTLGKGLGTRGALLSTLKKSAPRQSFDIDKYEHVRVPRLPSLGLALEAAPEEEDATPIVKRPFRGHGDAAGGEDEPGGEGEDDVLYEGNSMTLADILLHAGHQGNASAQLLDEDDLEGDASDWE